MDYTFKPIREWPGTLTKQRRPSPFKASYNRTMKDLERELGHLRASGVTLQLALGMGDIKRDGTPYADSKPTHPGVILTFATPAKKAGQIPPTMNFPCDTYTTWQDNLRAITLALEALRAVNRYGVTRNDEQYRGWSQLPPPAPVPATMTVEQAARFVASWGDYAGIDGLLGDQSIYANAYRYAARKLHPDANGGTQRSEWATLQTAKAILETHHAGRMAS